MKHTPRPERHGFTLVELLVVMAIIAVLVSLVSAAVFRASSLQYLRNTRATMIKLQEELEKAMRATTSQAEQEPIPPAILDLGGGDSEKARRIYVRSRLQQQFPNDFAQINSPPPGLAKVATYEQAIQGAPQDNRQNAICLYLALSMNRSGAGFDPEGMSPQELRSVPGTPNLKYFTDAWGQPLTWRNGVSLTIDAMPTPEIGSRGPDGQGGTPDDMLTTTNVRQGRL